MLIVALGIAPLLLMLSTSDPLNHRDHYESALRDREPEIRYEAVSLDNAGEHAKAGEIVEGGVGVQVIGSNVSGKVSHRIDGRDVEDSSRPPDPLFYVAEGGVEMRQQDAPEDPFLKEIQQWLPGTEWLPRSLGRCAVVGNSATIS